MTPEPNFEERAREWMIRVQGYARPEHVKSLAKMLEWAYEEGRSVEYGGQPKPPPGSPT